MSLLKDELHDFLQNLRREGRRFFVEWDGGGDESWIHFWVEEEYLNPVTFKLNDRLRDYLVQVLDIPSVGEEYFSGKGTIELDEDGNIMLDFMGKRTHLVNLIWDSFMDYKGYELERRTILFEEDIQQWTHKHLLNYLSKVRGELIVHGYGTESRLELKNLSYLSDLTLEVFEKKLESAMVKRYFSSIKGQQILSIFFQAQLYKDKIEFMEVGANEAPAFGKSSKKKIKLFED